MSDRLLDLIDAAIGFRANGQLKNAIFPWLKKRA
jgi:hypothetical protein